MVLSIALFVFSAVLLSIFIGLYIWWKKFGKELFNMVKNMGKTPQKPMNLGDLTKQMEHFSKIINKKR
jgi:hypothetical protein